MNCLVLPAEILRIRKVEAYVEDEIEILCMLEIGKELLVAFYIHRGFQFLSFKRSEIAF